MQRLRAERIEAEGDAGDRRLDMVAVDEAHERLRGVRRARRGVDRQRNAVVEADIGEQDERWRRRCRRSRPAAIGAVRAGEDEMQSVGAAVEVVERKRLATSASATSTRARMAQRPGVWRRARGAATCGARVERGDGERRHRSWRRACRRSAPFSARSTSLRHCSSVACGKTPASAVSCRVICDLSPSMFRAPFAHEARRRSPPQIRRAARARALFSRPNALTKCRLARAGRERRWRESRWPAVDAPRSTPTARECPRRARSGRAPERRCS